MKTIATIAVDLARSPLGMRSRLAENLCGKPVLRRTVERVLIAKHVDEIYLLTPTDQKPAVATLLAGLPLPTNADDALSRIKIQTVDQTPSYSPLVRAGRLWGLDGWRGGIGGLCCFDEDYNAAAVAETAQRALASAIISIPASACLIEPSMIDAMIDHFENIAAGFRMTFAQTPPGLSGVILHRELVDELATANQPPGMLLLYHPDRAFADLSGKEPCYRPPSEVIEARGRLIADTERSLRRLRELIEAGADAWDAARIGRWLLDRAERHLEPVPQEIEIELTTDDRLPEASLLRPRGATVGKRGPLKLDTIRSIAESIADHDDVRIVLAGFGDPLLHPQFAAICRVLRESTAATIAVRTPALCDDAAIENALFQAPVDVIEVTLDAMTAETYQKVHGLDAFESATGRVESWLARRQSSGSVAPFIVPSFVKSEDNIHEMEAFYDHWQRRLGACLVTGHSHYAGQRQPRALSLMAPPKRTVCRRTLSRAMILADGRLTTCDQDFAARQTIGRLDESPLSELWHSAKINAIRGNCFDSAPLCSKCDEWHRP
ncbi:MAG TPA: SPASM domain-containing protein [Phycisphaerae bacterium]|nr:SPASM domain-containing protein [Phycisphaerae bacterium]